MNPAGVFVPGTTWLHRVSAGVKVGGLFAAVLLVLLIRTPLLAGLAVLVAGVVLEQRTTSFRLMPRHSIFDMVTSRS